MVTEYRKLPTYVAHYGKTDDEDAEQVYLEATGETPGQAVIAIVNQILADEGAVLPDLHFLDRDAQAAFHDLYRNTRYGDLVGRELAHGGSPHTAATQDLFSSARSEAAPADASETDLARGGAYTLDPPQAGEDSLPAYDAKDISDHLQNLKGNENPDADGDAGDAPVSERIEAATEAYVQVARKEPPPAEGADAPSEEVYPGPIDERVSVDPNADKGDTTGADVREERLTDPEPPAPKASKKKTTQI